MKKSYVGSRLDSFCIEASITQARVRAIARQRRPGHFVFTPQYQQSLGGPRSQHVPQQYFWPTHDVWVIRVLHYRVVYTHIAHNELWRDDRGNARRKVHARGVEPFKRAFWSLLACLALQRPSSVKQLRTPPMCPLLCCPRSLLAGGCPQAELFSKRAAWQFHVARIACANWFAILLSGTYGPA